MTKTSHRILCAALVAASTLCFHSSMFAQAAEQRQGEVVTVSGTTSKSRVLAPDEKLVVNGQVVRVADFLSALSLLDSLEGQNLRSPEIRNREIVKPTPPATRPDSGCSAAAPPAQAGSCAEPKSQAPATKHPH